NVAQRPDRPDAAALEQCVRDRGQARHGIGARAHDVAEHEYLNGTQLAERDVRAYADHLLLDAVLNQRPHLFERQAAHAQRADLWEADRSLSAHRKEILRVLVAEELDV